MAPQEYLEVTCQFSMDLFSHLVLPFHPWSLTYEKIYGSRKFCLKKANLQGLAKVIENKYTSDRKYQWSESLGTVPVLTAQPNATGHITGTCAVILTQGKRGTWALVRASPR